MFGLNDERHNGTIVIKDLAKKEINAMDMKVEEDRIRVIEEHELNPEGYPDVKPGYAKTDRQVFQESVNQIAASNYAIAKSNLVISTSNADISEAILLAAGENLKGLNFIADEMAKKRKQEEYFTLLDRIELIEDKLIAAGLKLSNVYNEIQVEYQEPIDMTFEQIRIVLNYWQDKDLELRKELMRQSKINIFQFLLYEWEQLSKGLAIKICRDNSVCMALRDERNYIYYDLPCKLSYNYRIFGEFENDENIYFNVKGNEYIPRLYNGKPFEKCHMYMKDSIDGVYLNMIPTLKEELLNILISKMKNEKTASIYEKIEIEKFRNFLAEVNAEINLKNLYNLYKGLMKFYREIRMSK